MIILGNQPTDFTVTIKNIPGAKMQESWAKAINMAIKEFGVRIEPTDHVTLDFNQMMANNPQLFIDIVFSAKLCHIYSNGKKIMRKG